MSKRGISPELGNPHVSKDPERGYVEYDPIVRLSDGSITRGEHGLIDIRAEIARTAFDQGMLDSPIIQDIISH